MAGRFTFRSIGDAMAQGLRERLAEQEQARLQEIALARQAEQMQLQRNQDTRAAEAQTAALATQKVAADRLLKTDVRADLADLGVNADISGTPLAEQAKRLAPAMVRVTPPQPTLPSRTLPVPVSGVDDTAPVMQSRAIPSVQAPERVVGTGTKEQQELAAILKDPTTPERVKSYLRARQATGGENIPYQLYEGETTIPIFRRTTAGDVEKQTEKGWAKFTGELPEKHKFINEPNDQQGPSPYSMPVQTAVGIIPFNTRTRPGDSPWDFSRAAPSSLPAAARDALASNNTGRDLLGVIEKEFKPAFVGFVQGRVAEVQSKVFGESGPLSAPKGSSGFYANIATLKNQVIKAITGAQMSEDEARRIMNQLPTGGISEDAFHARVKSTRENMKRIETSIWEVGTGLRPPNSEAVTEAQLNEWYPSGRVSVSPKVEGMKTGGGGGGATSPTEGMTPEQKIEYYRKLGR